MKDSSSISWHVQWVEYSQYDKWKDKSFPRMIRGYNGKRQLIEVEFDEIKPLPELPADFFAAPKDATVWLDCGKGSAWKLKNSVPPQYPQDLRRRGMEGAVAIYAVIEEDGHLSNVSIAKSAGREFDNAAGWAVTQWTYERTDVCADSKGRSEVVLEIFFNIQQH